MFLVAYSSKGVITALTTGNATKEGQIEVTKAQYVELMEHPHLLNQYRVDTTFTLVKFVEVIRSSNPMADIYPPKPGKVADIAMELGKEGANIIATVDLDHSVILLGTKRTNKQARPFRIEFKSLNSSIPYSRPIDPHAYDWYVHHPVSSYTYSLFVKPSSPT